MNQILPRLFIGGLRDARDVEQMKANDIRYVLSIHETARDGNLQGVQYLCIQAADTPTQNLAQFFSASNDFIHRCRVQRKEEESGGGSVLIHCLAGVSRSVTLLVAYLISITSLSVKQALEAVRRVRAVAEPNPGFQRQLTDFEAAGGRLRAEQRRLAVRFPQLVLPSRADEEELRRLLSTSSNQLNHLQQQQHHHRRKTTTTTMELSRPVPRSSPATSKSTRFVFPCGSKEC